MIGILEHYFSDEFKKEVEETEGRIPRKLTK